MNIHDVYRPFLTYFRRKRMSAFLRCMSVDDSTAILDVGGTPFVWKLIDCRPPVTMINLGVAEWTDDNLRMLPASGTAIPFPDDSFDLCFSNSVIEHVGDSGARAAFAREVRRVSKRYWVQTPNRRFPVEPHFICLLLHWLPFRIRRRLIRHLSVWGWVTRPTQQRVDEALLGIELLTEADMRSLFPDGEIIRERFLGMVKSIIAIRR